MLHDLERRVEQASEEVREKIESLLANDPATLTPAAKAILEDIRDRITLKWLFADDPDNASEVVAGLPPLSLEVQHECVETWARLALEQTE